MPNNKSADELDKVKYKIAELMFLKLGIDMAREDRQSPLVLAQDRDLFLDEVVRLFVAEVRKAREGRVFVELQKLDTVEQQTFFAGLLYRWCMKETNANNVTIKLKNFSVNGDVKGDLVIEAQLTKEEK